MLLIGSKALKIVAPELVTRDPQDTDLVGTYDEIQEFLKANKSIFKQIYPANKGKSIIAKGSEGIFEFEIAWSDSAIAKYLQKDYPFKPSFTKILDQEVKVADINLLFTLKKSHRFLKNSPHFLKTMNDYIAMKNRGAMVTDQGFLEQREKETYDYAHPKLDVSKSDFFKDDGIKYVYDHDTIHESMKHLYKPAYQFFKNPNKEVLCDKNLFFDTDEKTRLYSVLEETQVLALERSQIPFGTLWTPKRSFDMALMKVCTSITSGWWRSYAWEHYHDVQALYEPDYVDKFWKAVETGVVKKLDTKG